MKPVDPSANLSVPSEFSWLPLLTSPDNKRKPKLIKIRKTITIIQRGKGFNTTILYILAYESQQGNYPKIDHRNQIKISKRGVRIIKKHPCKRE